MIEHVSENPADDQQQPDAPAPRRRAYRFMLRDGDSGVLITDAASVEAARRELAATYGDRLAAVGEG